MQCGTAKRLSFKRVWYRFLNARRAFDFWLRTRVRVRRPGILRPSLTDQKLGEEVGNFLQLFHWPRGYQKEPLRVVDVGAKNFFLAPQLERHFQSLHFDPEIVGIEMDAFRRYRTGWTRNDFGHLYAAQVNKGAYYALDFLNWHQPVDVALLLHPFVTLRALQAWGLPDGCFKPRVIMDHLRKVLAASQLQCLVISSPTERELAIVKTLAQASGFHVMENACWTPCHDSLQTQPRWGSLLSLQDPHAWRELRGYQEERAF